MSSWEASIFSQFSTQKTISKQVQLTQHERKVAQVWRLSSYNRFVYLGSNYNLITTFISRASFYQKHTHTQSLNSVESMFLKNALKK